MKYQNVALTTPVAALPPNTLDSDELERQLQPAYQAAGFSPGRLEFMTGIRQRRLWNPGTRPSDAAAQAGLLALRQAALPPSVIDALLFCSVSRDCLEPASATYVHHALGLRPDALNFDLSNACLGMASGIVTLAAMVEAGAIRAGLAVSGENAGPLLRSTVQHLNQARYSRRDFRPHFASLTIGSAATAVVVARRDLAPHPLLAAVSLADTASSQLCQGDGSGGMTDGAAPLMQTDSPELLQKGVRLAAQMWDAFKDTLGWHDDTPDLICTHQVGKGHRALLYNTLHLNPDRDFSTFPFLGNCGSASLTATLALAAQERTLHPGAHVALLGIGSGINCCGLALQW